MGCSTEELLHWLPLALGDKELSSCYCLGQVRLGLKHENRLIAGVLAKRKKSQALSNLAIFKYFLELLS